MALDDIQLNSTDGALVDLDDTLYSYPPAHQQAMEACYRRYVETFPSLAFETFCQNYKTAREAVLNRLSPVGACRSRFFAFQLMLEQEALRAPFRLALLLDELYWNVFLEHMVPDDQMFGFLNTCEERGIPVCVVSDMTSAVQVRKLERLGLAHRIAHLVTSEETGAEKPDPRMFLTGLAKLGVAPDRAVMIGDSVDKDVQGAQACGIKAELYKARKLQGAEHRSQCDEFCQS